MELSGKSGEDITFADLCVHYGTGRSIHVSGTGRDKKFRYRYGAMTDLGDLEISKWKSLINALIEQHGEQEIQRQLRQWSKAECPWLRSDDEIEEYALRLHAARIFDDPAWAGYITVNHPSSKANGLPASQTSQPTISTGVNSGSSCPIYISFMLFALILPLKYSLQH